MLREEKKNNNNKKTLINANAIIRHDAVVVSCDEKLWRSILMSYDDISIGQVFFVLFFFTQHVITRISSRVPLYCIVVDQINKLPEDGLKSSPEMSRYTENTWISRKIKIKLYFSYTLLIHFTVCLDKSFKYSNFCIPLQALLLSIAVSNDLINVANSIGLPENVIIFSVGNLTSFLMKNYVFFFINNYSV